MAARSLAALVLFFGVVLTVQADPPPPAGDPQTGITVGNASFQQEKGKATYTITAKGTCNLLKGENSFTGCSATLTPKGLTTDPDIVALVTYPDGQPTPGGGPKSVVFTWTGAKKATYQGSAVMGWLDGGKVQNTQTATIPKFEIK